MTTRDDRDSLRLRRRTQGLALILLLSATWLAGDDTFLFRTEASKPFVYVVFDTSSSMNLSPQGGNFVDANADDHRSTFYQAKRAVYEVFNQAFEQNGDFIHFGFMSYNQDQLRVRGKHWLYRVDGTGGSVELGNATYPVDGELLTFGQFLPSSATPDPVALPIPAPGQLGSCADPVSLTQEREAINRFPKLQPVDDDGDGFVDGMLDTELWLEYQNRTYLLEIEKQSASINHLLGESELHVKFELNDASDCGNPVELEQASIKLQLVTPFLMHDLVEDDDLGLEANKTERKAGIWNYQAADAAATCGDSQRPFTGEGYESNYDGGDFVGDPDDYPVVDPFCVGPDCETLKFPTTLDPGSEPERRTLDVGDMLPYHWEETNRNEFFRRMAPNWTPGKAFEELEFGVASYFRDVPNSDGFLELVDPNHRPLVPYGASPVGKCLNDWRCYYLGANQTGGKCKQSDQPFGDGFDDLAADNDIEWGCRKPFILVIGDGENNCKGENPGAETANLRRNRIQAWVINFGGPDSSDLRRLAQNTGGEYVAAENDGELVAALQNIVGEIIEQSRSFASAVVPTVQAEEDDKVFVSDFKPLNDAAVWPGNVRAFLKPVPLLPNGRPDTSVACGAGPEDDPASECYLWNAAESMLGQVQDIDSQFGLLPSQRRVYYSQLRSDDDWPAARRYFAPTSTASPTATRYDLWRGLGLVPPSTRDGSLSSSEEETHEGDASAILEEAFAMKFDPNGTPDDSSDDLPYILGDIFHSDPLLVGAPPNSLYFALGIGDDGSTCTEGNPSYRCFFRKHVNRRKVMLVGSSDGLVHAFDTGIRRTAGTFAGRFDRGTGKETFAFVPRSVLPKIQSLYGEGFQRTWLVDGTLVAGDVLIDPTVAGSEAPLAAEREWRTVAISGLREGGRGYFALDLTQPDPYDADGNPTGIDEYVPACADGGADCGPLPYPSQLWEFTDGFLVPDPPRILPFDKDFNGTEDLADGWSTPNIGRILVCVGSDCDPASASNDLEDRYVAIFGGGMDRTHEGGDWLYMVDIESGESIYKQRLLDGAASGGSAPSEPSAVDTDGDGYLDRVYIGTMRGLLYRADLRGPAGEIPVVESDFDKVSVGGSPLIVPVERIVDVDFAPRIVFRAQPDPASSVGVSRAIFYRPSIVFSAALGDYALAFGTGDREDLWTADGASGRFYMVRDDIDVGDRSTFYTEADLVGIDAEIDPEQAGDLLTDSSLLTKGWFFRLRPNERLIASPFVVSGVTIFSVFEPDVAVDLESLTCSRTGKSRVFGVDATNGNGLLFTEDQRTRWIEIADFVTQPFVEQSQTKNRENSGSSGPTADDLSEDHEQILEELKKLFPANCRFTNARLDIKTLSSDTGLHMIAPVPICVVEKNWKEH